MSSTAPPSIRRTTPGMQRMLVVASALVFIVGIQLFVFTEQTDRFFAWTIQSPLTAAFLGGGYWASFVLEWSAARKSTWAHARIAVPAVLLFTTLTLVVTLLHLDRFHFAAPSMITRGATWAWLVVYAVVPILMGALLIVQLRQPGGDPPRTAPIPNWTRVALLVQAIVWLPLGTALLIVPQATSSLWPWALTPLTARAIGAWLVSLGVAAVHATRENDWRRVSSAALSYAMFGMLQLIALVRYPGEMQWNSLAAWMYMLFVLAILLFGVYGVQQALRNERSRIPTPLAPA